MSESQTLKTLIHELSHSLLDDEDGPKIDIDRDEKTTRSNKEVTAELVSFTVMSFLGIENVGDYSFSYLAGWSSGKDLKELKASMEIIRKTASFIISGIEEKLLEKTSKVMDDIGSICVDTSEYL